VASLCGVRSIVNPAVGLRGVLDREEGPEVLVVGLGLGGIRGTPFPSPSLANVSMDFSRFPERPFKTAIFLFSSINPISRNFAIFMSKSSSYVAPTLFPNILDCLFILCDGDLSSKALKSSCCEASNSCRAAVSRLDFEDNGNIDDADLKPNLLPSFGGRGGG